MYERLRPIPGRDPDECRGRARSSRIRALLGAGAAALASALLQGCGTGAVRERSFEPASARMPVGRPVRWNATSAERFGISARDFAQPSAATELHWTTPEGWIELPPAQFREANFRLAGDERAECYLSTLSGEGGGLLANVNRWRDQLSLAPLSAEEVAALPRQPWLGGEAVFVDFAGTWIGRTGDGSADGWRLVGLLLVEPARSRFLKMTGPADVIAAEIERFRGLAASFRAEGGHAHDAPGAGE